MTIDVAIVGAGPAGLAAATRCARLGLAATLFDEQPAPGGQIHRGVLARRDAGEPPRDADDTRGLALVDALRASTAAYVADAAVWSARAMPDATVEIGVTVRGAGSTPRLVRARAAILATGALERPFPIPGWTLPGVMTAGGAQILLKTSGLVPQGRIVLAGTGPLLWLAAAQLQDAGATIDALLETTPRGRLREALAHAPAFLLSPYFRRGLDLARRVRRRTSVVEFVTALAAEGGAARVDAVRYVADGAEYSLPVDHLLLHQGVVPSIDLAGAAGCALVWNAQAAAFAPAVDEWGGTSVPSLFVTGDGAGIAGAEAAAARGALTALAVANALGRIDAATRDRQAAPLRRALADAQRGRRFFDTLYRPADAFRIPAGATLACRCEEVTAQQVMDAAVAGCTGPNQAKAWLRCGMGPCQGRYCGLTVTELIARTRGATPQDVGALRARFPVKPLTLAELAAVPTNAAAQAAVVRAPGH